MYEPEGFVLHDYYDSKGKKLYVAPVMAVFEYILSNFMLISVY